MGRYTFTSRLDTSISTSRKLYTSSMAMGRRQATADGSYRL